MTTNPPTIHDQIRIELAQMLIRNDDKARANLAELITTYGLGVVLTQYTQAAEEAAIAALQRPWIDAFLVETGHSGDATAEAATFRTKMDRRLVDLATSHPSGLLGQPTNQLEMAAIAQLLTYSASPFYQL